MTSILPFKPGGVIPGSGDRIKVVIHAGEEILDRAEIARRVREALDKRDRKNPDQ